MTIKFGPEAQQQIAVIDFIEQALGEVLIWHTPNQGKRNPAYVKKLKIMGLLPGVPDLCFLPHWDNRGKFPVYFIEMKAKSGRLSQEQVDFRNNAINRGAAWGLARNVAEVEKLLIQWGFKLKVRYKSI